MLEIPQTLEAPTPCIKPELYKLNDTIDDRLEKEQIMESLIIDVINESVNKSIERKTIV